MWPQNHAISFSVIFAKMLHKFCSGEKFGVFVKMKPMTMFLIMLAGWINRHQQVAMQEGHLDSKSIFRLK